MAERLKDMFFTEAFVQRLARQIKDAYPDFDTGKFVGLVFNRGWHDKELKQRMRHISECLHATLPEDYQQSLAILLKAAPGTSGFDAMVFPDFVECYGLEYRDDSIRALKEFTRLCSSEYGIRPFIVKEPKKTLATMLEWAGDSDRHVRRLASEGCRPRLPWAMALPQLKKDPSLILPILEKLKDDESEYVRKSVANNLNDISKDNPDLALDISEKWYGRSERTDWIVKHGCRTLLKAGNTRAMRLFGFGDPAKTEVRNFKLDQREIFVGESVNYAFELVLKEKQASDIRLELRVDYVKSNGKTSRKIFQLGEKTFEPGTHAISRKHDFKNLSTRKHFPGMHTLAVILNGVEKASVRLEITPGKV